MAGMPRIDCGIDIGSTNLKVILVADGGGVLYSKTVPTPRVQDDLGPVTDPLAMVALLKAMILEGWRSVGEGVALRSIAAAGVGEDGVGEDGVGVGADMAPTGRSIPWFDMQARGEAGMLAARFGHLAPVAGIAIGPDRTAAK